MKKMLYIMAALVIFALCVPGLSLARPDAVGPSAHSKNCVTGVPVDPSIVLPPAPESIPDSALPVLSDMCDMLMLAYTTHNYDMIVSYAPIAEQKIADAMGTVDRNDVKVMVNVDPAEPMALVKVMIRPDCLDKKLEADVKAMLNDEGQRVLDIKIKGDVTEQQQALFDVLLGKVQARLPGIVVKIKYL